MTCLRAPASMAIAAASADCLKNSFFDELELHATSIVTLDPDETRRTG